MRRLLSFLGIVSISASTATVVGCEYANLVKSSVENKVRNYVNVSSLLARATILSQKAPSEGNQTSDGEGYSLKAATRYLYPQSVKNYYSKSALPGAEDFTVREMMGSVFGFGSSDSFVYTVKENANFQTNLDLAESPDEGLVGDSPLTQTLSLISGVLAIVLGNNFNDSQAPTIENFIGAGGKAIVEAITKDSGALLGTILQFIGLKNQDADTAPTDWIFTAFEKSLHEDDLDPGKITTLTFDEVFKIRQKSF